LNTCNGEAVGTVMKRHLRIGQSKSNFTAFPLIANLFELQFDFILSETFDGMGGKLIVLRTADFLRLGLGFLDFGCVAPKDIAKTFPFIKLRKAIEGCTSRQGCITRVWVTIASTKMREFDLSHLPTGIHLGRILLRVIVQQKINSFPACCAVRVQIPYRIGASGTTTAKLGVGSMGWLATRRVALSTLVIFWEFMATHNITRFCHGKAIKISQVADPRSWIWNLRGCKGKFVYQIKVVLEKR